MIIITNKGESRLVRFAILRREHLPAKTNIQNQLQRHFQQKNMSDCIYVTLKDTLPP